MKHLTIAMLLLAYAWHGYGQQIKSVAIAATTEAIGLPFTNYSPYHPGLEVRATLKAKESSKTIQRYNINLGMYYHQRLQTGVYLGGEYQFTRKLLKEQLGLDLPVGLGYLHTFYPGSLYEQNDAGDFEAVSQLGRPHLSINLGVGFTYLKPKKIQPFIRQELMIQTPFANGIPVIPHSFLKIGVNINLNNHENK